jgi:hypothetical protein
MFHVHFEKNLESKLVEKLKANLSEKSKLNQMEQEIQVRKYVSSFVGFKF